FPGPQPVPVSPPASGNFVNGVWSGSVAVLQALNNVYLSANDRNGHQGFSSTFNVLPGIDLAVSLAVTPVLAQIGQNITYSITLTNRGGLTATAVVLTNVLPAGVNFVSA